MFAKCADVTSDIDQFCAEAFQELGRLDVAVLNTGSVRDGSLQDVEPADFDDGFAVLVRPLIRATFAMQRAMAGRGGRIILLATAAIQQPSAELVVSSTVRPSLLGFCKAAAPGLADEGITINCVCPGYVWTDGLQEMIREVAVREGVGERNLKDRWIANVAMRRFAEPEEVAALVEFLGSEEAGYITGQAIAIDGGLLRHTSRAPWHETREFGSRDQPDAAETGSQ